MSQEPEAKKRKREAADKNSSEEAQPPPLKKNHLMGEPQLETELWHEIILLLSSDVTALCVCSLVCKDWHSMVLKARKEFIKKFSERQLALIAESQREIQFGKESFVDRVEGVFTSGELARIHKSMLSVENGATWGMSIHMKPRKGFNTIVLKKEPRKEAEGDDDDDEDEDRGRTFPPSVYLAAEKKVPIGVSKRGGLPHLPPHLSWPKERLFGAQYSCRDVALFDFRCLFPVSGILYFFFLGWDGEEEQAEVLYYDGPIDVLSPALPPDTEDMVANIWLAEFENAKEKPEYDESIIFRPDADLGFTESATDETHTCVYTEFGEDFRCICMYADMFNSWEALKKWNWDKVLVSSDPSG